MKKIAIIVPTYPPHFSYAEELRKSFCKCQYNEQSDLCFIFTSEEEKALWKHDGQSIVIPEKYRIFERRGIINIKKIYAIHCLKDAYEYLIVLDSESKFINKQNLYALCTMYFERKVLLGNSISPHLGGQELANQIINSCIKWFPDETKNNIMGGGGGYYLWFNQPCIYKSSTIEKYFQVTNLYKHIDTLTFVDFDYYIYMFYLLIYEDFRIINMEIDCFYGFCESYEFKNKWKSKLKKHLFYVCNKYLYDKIPNKYIFALIQLNIERPPLIKIIKRNIIYYIKSYLNDKQILFLKRIKVRLYEKNN